MQTDTPRAERTPAPRIVTFWTRPPLRPGSVLPVLAAEPAGLAELAAAELDGAAEEVDRWYAAPVILSAPEPAAFAAWRGLSGLVLAEALRRWAEVFPVSPELAAELAAEAPWPPPVATSPELPAEPAPVPVAEVDPLAAALGAALGRSLRAPGGIEALARRLGVGGAA
jgi:hypothetical protein